jgi:hypothetical protein
VDETTRVYDSVSIIAKSQALHVCRRRLTKPDWTLHKEGFDLLLIHCGEVLAEDSEVRGSFWPWIHGVVCRLHE